MELACEDFLERLEKIRERANQTAIQNAVHFRDLSERYHEISAAADNTFSWIFKDASGQLASNKQLILPFEAWLEKGEGIFHISGKPGSGKSTLMKYLCAHTRTKSTLKQWAGDKGLVIGRFFFWSRGGQMQKSLLGLIRALAYHVITQCPDVIPGIFPQHWDPAAYDVLGQGPAVSLENDDILRAFQQLVAVEDIYENYRYCFFIDGLDEFDEPLQTYTGLISSLWSWVKTSQGHLKLCVSSRELPPFHQRFDPSQRLRLQDLTIADIRSVVRQTIQQEQIFMNQILADKEDMDRLQQAIISKADGVFLWVVLTLKSVCEALQTGESISDTLQVLDTLPQKLEDFLQYIVDSIPVALRKKAAFTFAFALGVESLPLPSWNFEPIPQLRALLSPSLLRYSFLDDLADDQDFATRASSPLSADAIQERMDNAQVRIAGRCKGLLEFRDSSLAKELEPNQKIVRFTHRSIPEFLERYLAKGWKENMLGFELVHAYISTFVAALKLFRLDTSLRTCYYIDTEIYCALRILHNAEDCDSTALTCLDNMEKALYTKQLEASPAFPKLRWAHFHTTSGAEPAFLSVFFSALRFHSHRYIEWRLNREPTLVANRSDAESFIAIIKGIYFYDHLPASWFARTTPNDVLLVTLAILKRGADPNVPSLHPTYGGATGWGYLLTMLTKHDDHDVKDWYWAVAEAILQFGGPLPQWTRVSSSSIIVSVPGTSTKIDVLDTVTQPWRGGKFDESKLPKVLEDVGATATVEDFVTHQAPENSELLLQILATRERDSEKV